MSKPKMMRAYDGPFRNAADMRDIGSVMRYIRACDALLRQKRITINTDAARDLAQKTMDLAIELRAVEATEHPEDQALLYPKALKLKAAIEAVGRDGGMKVKPRTPHSKANDKKPAPQMRGKR